MSAVDLLSSLSDVGRDPRRGGYSRPVFSTAELDLRSWFVTEAERRGLSVEIDANGALWAWQDVAGGDRSDAVVTGSHLDSVPGGGAFDGPLGVVSALAAIDLLRARSHEGQRPLAVVVFPEEEGSRFGLACLGSSLMTGAVRPERALNLSEENGDTLADLSRANGLDPDRMGPDPATLARIGAFVELHVEQGRGLIDLEQPVAIGTSIIGHGRWRIRVHGQGNHAGTTAMSDRRDPMTCAANIVLAVQDTARAVPDGRATVGRLLPMPGGANVIASSIDIWLDIRHPDDAIVEQMRRRIEFRTQELAAAEACIATSPSAHFDPGFRDLIGTLLPQAPLLTTGAGHDAGVLARHVPTAMLFVRNPTGISHSPEEHAEDADVLSGAEALATVLEHLTRAATPAVTRQRPATA
jgi:beta-ureidopropionase / N-carbamoyl-L-amino-acid hydrolase